MIHMMQKVMDYTRCDNQRIIHSLTMIHTLRKLATKDSTNLMVPRTSMDLCAFCLYFNGSFLNYDGPKLVVVNDLEICTEITV
jgi:hypothetical protein